MSKADCADCPGHVSLRQGGMDFGKYDHLIALAGNPNTGKSTVFNALTGLHQHTGNWPGKTITRAEGGFQVGDARYKLIDLPGTYSLLSTSRDEEIARDFILLGRPDVTVVVVDATRLERNLNLALQVLQITDRVVVCLNLMDEARAHGLDVDHRGLSRNLSVPVVPTAARSGEGIDGLIAAVREVATGALHCRPKRLRHPDEHFARVIDRLAARLRDEQPDLANAEWIAQRLLDGDKPPPALSEWIEDLRWTVPERAHDQWVEHLYGEAARLAGDNVDRVGASHRNWQRSLDRLLTSRATGVPAMLLLFAGVLWLTITGANYPSAMLAEGLIEKGYPLLRSLAEALSLPWWLSGLLIDGMYLTTAWVVSVMLPPMAIFFPLFTILEDFGYLPRVAFVLDNTFRKVGANGKQALTMCMGFGCNAAGVIAARIIDSPRERLVAIITNNFALCNGRWPTQILVATVFMGALVSGPLAGLAATAAVLTVAILGVGLMFATSALLSRTVLKGVSSSFSLELPPYRPPAILRTLYTSLIDRTLFVLWRAVLFAMPAGLLIWTIANIPVGDASLAETLVHSLDPIGLVFGLNGVILVAYIVAIPANEIVIPTVLMLTVLMTGLTELGSGAGVIFETEGAALDTLLRAGGWTTLTAVCLMVFSLCHNPCSTTIYTIWKETLSVRWTVWSTLLPLAIGFVLCGVIAVAWRMLL